MAIHPTAIVDRKATIDSTADIGPYVIIEGTVVVGPGTRIGPHAVIFGPTTIGANNWIHTGAVIGDVPQDRAYQGEETSVVIGDGNIIREYVEIHRATQPGSTTRIGNGNFLMSHSHVAHNCVLENNIVLASGALLAGHVHVEDGAFISGNCVVHQYVRVGKLALMRGLSRTSRDVPPFCIMDGTHTVRGINRVGLRRAGYSSAQIQALHRAFRTLFFRPGNLSERLQRLGTEPQTAEVRYLIEFVRSSRRGVCRGARQRAGSDDD
ncbi:MAG: acyl-[acyl-carrier-protein]--UDP-N-acetylglucosamine O-acyltransferase [Candidatus Binatia bacterium]|nr:MAG: acyl-[acyl-carrier-protein]--UDP-N-acetylglucosamine O-acyltransferase [Candidatus Binatia bacterium]